MKKNDPVLKIFVQGVEPLQTYTTEVHKYIGSIKNWANLKIFNPDSSIAELDKYVKTKILLNEPKYLTIIGYGIGCFYGYNIALKTGARFIGINPIMNPNNKSINRSNNQTNAFKNIYFNYSERCNDTKAVIDKNYISDVSDLTDFYDTIQNI